MVRIDDLFGIALGVLIQVGCLIFWKTTKARPWAKWAALCVGILLVIYSSIWAYMDNQPQGLDKHYRAMLVHLRTFLGGMIAGGGLALMASGELKGFWRKQ